eukprot:SAG31_NODE_1805_length_7233_cov_5.304738_2_plen_1964_part_01
MSFRPPPVGLNICNTSRSPCPVFETGLNWDLVRNSDGHGTHTGGFRPFPFGRFDVSHQRHVRRQASDSNGINLTADAVLLWHPEPLRTGADGWQVCMGGGYAASVDSPGSVARSAPVVQERDLDFHIGGAEAPAVPPSVTRGDGSSSSDDASCITVEVGSGPMTEAYTLDSAYRCPLTVDRSNWLGDHDFNYQFQVTQESDSLWVVRNQSVSCLDDPNFLGDGCSCSSLSRTYPGILADNCSLNLNQNYYQSYYQRHSTADQMAAIRVACPASCGLCRENAGWAMNLRFRCCAYSETPRQYCDGNPGGILTVGYPTFETCRDACTAESTCTAFDWGGGDERAACVLIQGDDRCTLTPSDGAGHWVHYQKAGIAHAGEHCWDTCGRQQGLCSWCGTGGYCCRHGWDDHSNGCDGTIGVAGIPHHVCAAAAAPSQQATTVCRSGAQACKGNVVNLDQLPGVSVTASPDVTGDLDAFIDMIHAPGEFGDSPTAAEAQVRLWDDHHTSYTDAFQSNVFPHGDAYITVDLGALQTVTGVTVWHYYGDVRRYCNQRIALSTTGLFDGEEKVIYDTRDGCGPLENRDGNVLIINGTAARYVRHWSGGAVCSLFDHDMPAASLGYVQSPLNAAAVTASDQECQNLMRQLDESQYNNRYTNSEAVLWAADYYGGWVREQSTGLCWLTSTHGTESRHSGPVFERFDDQAAPCATASEADDSACYREVQLAMGNVTEEQLAEWYGCRVERTLKRYWNSSGSYSLPAAAKITCPNSAGGTPVPIALSELPPSIFESPETYPNLTPNSPFQAFQCQLAYSTRYTGCSSLPCSFECNAVSYCATNVCSPDDQGVAQCTTPGFQMRKIGDCYGPDDPGISCQQYNYGADYTCRDGYGNCTDDGLDCCGQGQLSCGNDLVPLRLVGEDGNTVACRGGEQFQCCEAGFGQSQAMNQLLNPDSWTHPTADEVSNVCKKSDGFYQCCADQPQATLQASRTNAGPRQCGWLAQDADGMAAPGPTMHAAHFMEIDIYGIPGIAGLENAGRRLQQDSSCGQRAGEVTAACCVSSDGAGHRLLQSGEQCTMPDQCSPTCAPTFVAFRDDCPEMLELAGFDMRQVEQLYDSCVEQLSVDEGSCGAQMGRRLQRLATGDTTMVSSGATTAMIIPLTIVTNEQTGMLEVLGHSGRRRSLQAGVGAAEEVQQFRCQCGGRDVYACLPPCSEEIHGYELLLSIDSSDLRVSCKLHNGLYSWAGAVSEGSYFGDDFSLFLSVVVSGAEGRYHLRVVESPGVRADVAIRRNQIVQIYGDEALETPPDWGSGRLRVQDGGTLSLRRLLFSSALTAIGHGSRLLVNNAHVDASTSFTTSSGAMLSLSRLELHTSTLQSIISGLSEAGSMISFDGVSVSNLGRCSRQTCGALQWPSRGADPAVCAESDSGFRCAPRETAAAAAGICESIGARLCTASELENGEGQGTGCDHDTLMLWSSSTESSFFALSCATGEQVVVSGNNREVSTCRSIDDHAAVRCCADVCDELSGTATVPALAGDRLVLEPLDLPLRPFFKVQSGACLVSFGGLCVGRPAGYDADEECKIQANVGGVLGRCPVFNTRDGTPPPGYYNAPDFAPDALNFPDGTSFGGTDCPAGHFIGTGQSLAWHSQDERTYPVRDGAWMRHVAGWQICFDENPFVESEFLSWRAGLRLAAEDDSCDYANDGKCSDGRWSGFGATAGCSAGTDASDCTAPNPCATGVHLVDSGAVIDGSWFHHGTADFVCNWTLSCSHPSEVPSLTFNEFVTEEVTRAAYWTGGGYSGYGHTVEATGVVGETDVLTLFDGPNSTSPRLAELSATPESEDLPLPGVATGSSMLVQLTSDGSMRHSIDAVFVCAPKPEASACQGSHSQCCVFRVSGHGTGRECSQRSCTSLGWQPGQSDPAVCAAEADDGFLCTPEATFAEAANMCGDLGARLCIIISRRWGAVSGVEDRAAAKNS